MSAVTIKVTEAVPDDWPSVVDPSDDALAFADAAWLRVEAYIALRVAERAVEFIAEGCGSWVPPLRPTTITTVERWTGTAWEAVTDLPPSPLGGYELPGGTWRFQGVAGDDMAEPPELVAEAVRRLAAYLAAAPGKPGASSESVAAGSVTIATTRSAAWRARAIDNSGAGDLLRAYRRA